jgi:UDP-N-acetylmuramate--alanine ligase
VTAGLSCQVETIGFNPEADWVVSYDVDPGPSHVKVSQSATVAKAEHAAARRAQRVQRAVALALGVMARRRPGDPRPALSHFRGVDRRMQLLGERQPCAGDTVRVYDDYGHHPTEVETTLRALREFERPRRRAGD